MLLDHRDRKLLAAMACYQKYRDAAGPWAWAMRKAGKLRYTLWTIVSASDININTRIPASVRFPHLNGVVIHMESVIGEDCFINQQVTIGQVAGSGAPVIGARVYIGTGAKVLGDITIGDDARIGANAVVLRDVPAGATAVGVPARIIPAGERKEKRR